MLGWRKRKGRQGKLKGGDNMFTMTDEERLSLQVYAVFPYAGLAASRVADSRALRN